MGLQQTSVGHNNNDQYPHFYLCNYLPGSVGRDTFSNSLLKFKRGEHPDLEGWIDCTLEESTGLPIREETIILRALHHHEPIANPLRPASLDLLGKALASRFQCRYLPGLLHKSRPVEEIKKLTREQRVIALDKAYRFSTPSANPHDPYSTPYPHGPRDHSDPYTPHDYRDHRDHPDHQHHYLILDDIVTTGSTLNAIIEAINREYAQQEPNIPSPSILAFSLAKADYDASFNLFHSLQGRNYRLEQGDTHWLLAEEEETYQPYYSPLTLGNWIREDSFPPARMKL
jgi:predicted amidophosphoribosyltransferase